MDRSERLRKRRQKRYEATRKPRTRERTTANRTAEQRYADTVKARQTREQYEQSEAREHARERYEQSGKGRQTRARTRAERADREYRGRRVIALDGEGFTGADGSHRYVLLAASTGESVTDFAGLPTVVVFRWLLELSGKYPGALFVGFGFDYDANMILKDLPLEHVQTLEHDEHVKAGPWRIRYRPGRYFGVRDVNDVTRITVWDVRSYWRSSFVDALTETFGDVDPVIVDGKRNRHTFTESDFDSIAGYNAAELEQLVRLVEHLRAGLDRVNIRPGRWDGPGAIATVLMKRHNMANTFTLPPEPVQIAAQHGFYGGRVECLKWGTSRRGGWQYDMRSAYPWALTQCPNWARGHWVHHKGDPGNLPFTLYDVKWWDWFDGFAPTPFPWRSPGGGIAYPYRGRGWYWSPEVAVARETTAGLMKHITITEAWQYVPDDPNDTPWAWVNGEYERRQQLANTGDNAAANAVKLGLAALYGKTAQRVGYEPAPLVLPRFHHLPTAGLVTSHVRAAVYRAAHQDLDAIIAIETDALITSRRLRSVKPGGVYGPTLGDGLGEWSETRLDVLTYCNTGAAFWELDGTEHRRAAGISSRELTHGRVLEALRNGWGSIGVDVDRFVTMGVAAEIGWEHWGRWNTVTESFATRPKGKREAFGPAYGTRWNTTVCPVEPETFSGLHPLPWTMDEATLAEYERRERFARIQAQPT